MVQRRLGAGEGVKKLRQRRRAGPVRKSQKHPWPSAEHRKSSTLRSALFVACSASTPKQLLGGRVGLYIGAPGQQIAAGGHQLAGLLRAPDRRPSPLWWS